MLGFRKIYPFCHVMLWSYQYHVYCMWLAESINKWVERMAVREWLSPLPELICEKSQFSWSGKLYTCQEIVREKWGNFWKPLVVATMLTYFVILFLYPLKLQWLNMSEQQLVPKEVRLRYCFAGIRTVKCIRMVSNLTSNRVLSPVMAELLKSIQYGNVLVIDSACFSII